MSRSHMSPVSTVTPGGWTEGQSRYSGLLSVSSSPVICSALLWRLVQLLTVPSMPSPGGHLQCKEPGLSQGEVTSEAKRTAREFLSQVLNTTVTVCCCQSQVPAVIAWSHGADERTQRDKPRGLNSVAAVKINLFSSAFFTGNITKVLYRVWYHYSNMGQK